MWKKPDAHVIVYLGILTALEIVLDRFLSVQAWNIKIGFSFLPIAAAGMLFGPLAGAVVAALGDFLGAVLFPIGPYFPGFTLTAALTGLTFGLFLRKRRSVLRTLAAVSVNMLLLSFLLNSLWISILYGTPFSTLLAVRAVQCAVLGPVQFLVLILLGRVLDTYGKRLIV